MNISSVSSEKLSHHALHRQIHFQASESEKTNKIKKKIKNKKIKKKKLAHFPQHFDSRRRCTVLTLGAFLFKNLRSEDRTKI